MDEQKYEYAFDITLQAVARVMANSVGEAQEKLCGYDAEISIGDNEPKGINAVGDELFYITEASIDENAKKQIFEIIERKTGDIIYNL